MAFGGRRGDVGSGPTAPAGAVAFRHGRRYLRFVSVHDDRVILRGGDSTIVLDPSLGGKISSLHLAGREWLWTSDVLPHRVPDDTARGDDASYVELADTGGYDECFPTVGACVIPPRVAAFGGLRLPDHGELWSHQPRLEIRRAPEGVYATTEWVGRRMPYTFARSLHVDAAGVAVMRYAATNTGRSPLPFLWSAHPLLPLTDRTRVRLPVGARLRVDAAHGFVASDARHGESESATGDDQQRWPLLSMNGTGVDISLPAAVGDGVACKLFLDLPPGPVRATVEEGDARLHVDFDGQSVPHFGLWINNQGWTPFRTGRPYRNLAFEPCIGAPDSLATSIDSWDSAAWIPPGETREWSLRWSGSSG